MSMNEVVYKVLDSTICSKISFSTQILLPWQSTIVIDKSNPYSDNGRTPANTPYQLKTSLCIDTCTNQMKRLVKEE